MWPNDLQTWCCLLTYSCKNQFSLHSDWSWASLQDGPSVGWSVQSDGWTDGCTHAGTDGWLVGHMERCMHRPKHVQTDGQMDGCTYTWMDGWLVSWSVRQMDCLSLGKCVSHSMRPQYLKGMRYIKVQKIRSLVQINLYASTHIEELVWCERGRKPHVLL